MSVLKNILGTDPTDLLDQGSELYRCFEIRPRQEKRKPRQINAPCEELRRTQRQLLEKVLAQVPPHPAATAFFKGRSIGANARAHHLCEHLFKTDISNFFSSIRVEQVHTTLHARFPHLSDKAISEIVALTTLNGTLPQGAPTSPHLANLVLFDFDEQIARLCLRIGAVYTRYADDIAVSAEDEEALNIVESAIRSGLAELGLTPHSQKTRRLGSDQRKIVTGLDVSAPIVRPPRAYRKKAAALVRMSEIYPRRMSRHFPRVMGYLAHWEGTCPEDTDMRSLKFRMKRLMRGDPTPEEHRPTEE